MPLFADAAPRALALALVLAASAVACGGATASIDLNNDGGGLPPIDHPQDAGPRDATPPPHRDASPPARVPVQHRPAPLACSHARGPVLSSDAGLPNVDAGAQCDSDADCTHGINGRCMYTGGWGYRACTYDECFTDSDCGAGAACSCGVTANSGVRTAANQCVKGNCTVDGDCGQGGYCSPTIDQNGCQGGPGGFYCHTAEDECIDNTDCSNAERCNYDPTRAHWACAPMVVCAG